MCLHSSKLTQRQAEDASGELEVDSVDGEFGLVGVGAEEFAVHVPELAGLQPERQQLEAEGVCHVGHGVAAVVVARVHVDGHQERRVGYHGLGELVPSWQHKVIL